MMLHPRVSLLGRAMVHLSSRRRRSLAASRGWRPLPGFEGVLMGSGSRGTLAGRVDGVGPLGCNVLHLLIMSRAVMVEHTFGVRCAWWQARENESPGRVAVIDWTRL